MRFLTFILFCYCSFLVEAQKINSPLAYTVNASDKSEARPPLLIMLHGYGSNEIDLFDIAKVLDPRFITVSVRAPNAMGNGAFNWFEFRNENGKRTYDYKAAEKSRQLILSFIANAARMLGADSTRVFVMGFSQGAIMSYELAIAAPGKIKGILALSGRLMEETKTLKTDVRLLQKLSVFIAHGRSDQVILPEESEKASLFFKEKQVKNVQSLLYDMPHSICGAELNDIKAWLIKVLNEKPESLTK